METVAELYRNAPHYDWEHRNMVADIPFNVRLARDYASRGRVLEFACGTGRVTFPLIEAGLDAEFDVVGVDVTPAMLEIAKGKLAKADASTQSWLSLIEGDMRSVNVGHGEFDLVLVPFNSFMHMMTQADQLVALENAYNHLVPGGYFMADLFLPDVARLGRNMGPAWLEVERRIEITEEDKMLLRSGAFSFRQDTQVLSATWLYQIFELSGGRRMLDSYWSPLSMRVIFAPEWQLLLERVGFVVVEKWGTFDRQPFGPKSPKMLFLAQKPA